MEESIKSEQYEQFETMDIEDKRKYKHKRSNKSFLYPKKIIKLLLFFITVFFILFLII